MSDEIKNFPDGQPAESTFSYEETSNNSGLSGKPEVTAGTLNGKPWLLILNLVLLLAVILLYVLHFTGKSKSSEPDISQTLAKAKSGKMAVAFVNNDTILQNYEFVKKLRKDLEAKESRLSNEITAKQAAFDKDAAYFQEHVQKKAISDQSAQEIYASLTQNQQKINGLRDQYAAELQQNEQNMNVAVLDSIMNFLHRYNQKYKFDYILGFNKGGNILYANDTLDITREVLNELNSEYSKKQH